MTNQPLFSVLIANYNNGKYLMDAIESVRRQTYTNWEIILVDDCSTDNSHELYKELEQDERIHIFLNDQNHGCGYTKRRCAELANGEICGFLDPDDALTENALEVMVEEHKKREDVSLISSRFRCCDENLNTIWESKDKEDIPNGISFLEFQSAAITHFVTFKYALYKKTDGINSSLLRAVDHDLYYLLEEVGEVLFINECLYCYRTNTGLNISLGDNYIKSVMWDFISMVEACKRRNICPEKFVFDSLMRYVKEEREDAKRLAKDEMRQTITYRVGKVFTYPVKLFRKIISNYA